MARVLYITANPKKVQDSFSLSAGEAFVNAYREVKPQDEIIELDLYKIQIPLVDADVFSGWGKLQQGTAFEQLTADEKAKVGRINELCDQFVSADKYIFVSPMWNLSVPPMLKAYFDTVCIAGKTFKYTENGPVGLLAGKKAVHIQARGGVYTEGPGKDFELGDRYVRSQLTFLGVGPIESVIAEGMAQMPDQAETIKSNTIERAKQVAKNF
ncbi:FMN-dependent NADH-azoreductase [Paradesulfitobacterium ferrireducens]|uniref:FMN-dependent NADH-azoreductase n=1 Tax=Paradesulfitobacterium ferrireducens TaxID=2816476 RepID=UPI001A901E4E|nr:FMN-dependent NADH-azoreductase [Paradesulfitobacterium ferrireducens]